MLCCVEGLMGSGKTTVLQILENRYGLRVRYEPVQEWEPYLALFYSDPRRWAFLLQCKVVCTEMTDAERVYDIRERSIESTREVFTRMLADDGLLQQHELSLITQLQQGVDQHDDIGKVFYIDAPMKICMRRIHSRARASENSAGSRLDERYMQQLETYYKRWLHSLPSTVEVVKLDGTAHPCDLADIIADRMNT